MANIRGVERAGILQPIDYALGDPVTPNGINMSDETAVLTDIIDRLPGDIEDYLTISRGNLRRYTNGDSIFWQSAARQADELGWRAIPGVIMEGIRYETMLAGHGVQLSEAPSHNALWDEILQDTAPLNFEDSKGLRPDYELAASAWVIADSTTREQLEIDYGFGRDYKAAGFVFDYTIPEEDPVPNDRDLYVDPADFLESEMVRWAPGGISSEDLVRACVRRAEIAGIFVPNEGKHLITIAQDLIDNDLKTFAEGDM